MIKKIISGGQTGADIAAIDAAIDSDFPWGGMIPKGRKCETGTVDLKYDNFTESTVAGYEHRTRRNVILSDGTLIFSKGKPTSGTKLTVELAKELDKPYYLVDITLPEYAMIPVEKFIMNFIKDNKIEILNVAGPRASKTPEIYDYVYNKILVLLKK